MGLQLDRSDLEADNCIGRLMEYGIVWGAELDYYLVHATCVVDDGVHCMCSNYYWLLLLRASPPLCFFPGKFYSWLTSHTHHNRSLQLQFVTYALTWGLVNRVPCCIPSQWKVGQSFAVQGSFCFCEFSTVFSWFFQNLLPLNQNHFWDHCHSC